MIGAAGFHRFKAGARAGLDLEARPSYKLVAPDARSADARPAAPDAAPGAMDTVDDATRLPA